MVPYDIQYDIQCGCMAEPLLHVPLEKGLPGESMAPPNLFFNTTCPLRLDHLPPDLQKEAK